jgi:diguanylate cyclase (GGDEF)-like protein
VNRFKAINDRFGHDRGDQVLRMVARRIGNTLRGSDTVFRIGGDEFAVLLPEGRDKAYRAAARLRRAFGERDDSKPVDPDHPTISVGAAAFGGSESPEDLFQRADADMYEDKTHPRRSRDTASEGPPETQFSVLMVRGEAARLEHLARQLVGEGYLISFGRDDGTAVRERSAVSGVTGYTASLGKE